MFLNKTYLLFEINRNSRVSGSAIDTTQIIDSIKSHCDNHGFKPILIYPTHDQKCYASLERSAGKSIDEFREFWQKNPIKPISLFIDIELVEEIANRNSIDKFSKFAYYELNEGLLENLVDKNPFEGYDQLADEPIILQSLFRKIGLEYVRIAELDEDPQKATPAHYMLKLDSYQKEMLEFRLNLNLKKATPNVDKKSTSNNNNNSFSRTDGNQSSTESPKKGMTISSPMPQRTEINFGRGQNDSTGDSEIRVQIFQGDLVRLDVNVIVNAANEFLLLGGGIAGAIDTACGHRVQDDCNKYLLSKGIKKIRISDVT